MNCEKRMFITRQGTQVLFGELSDIDYKFSVLETIMDRLVWEKRSANRIDLRVPSNPVTQ